ncbi:MAG: hypothetical protein L0332_06760 [Chloroflexi bacterium]|nr:hypothetical protein [Chloroflexota bacterium]
MTTEKTAVFNDEQVAVIFATAVATWGLTRMLLLSFVATLLALLIVVGYGRGWWQGLWARSRPVASAAVARLARLFKPPQRREYAGGRLYDVLLGFDEATGKPIVENLESLKSGLFAGTSGFGKTTWAQNFVDYLVRTHSANRLKIAIGDVKRVSFTPWRNIPHLFCPIARSREEHGLMIAALVQEMERRQRLFEVYQDRFCENLADYYRFSGVLLPRIVVIIDELADAVQPGCQAYEQMVTLAKMGRFVGIHLFIGTQRPSSAVLTGEVLSQIVTKCFAYMPNNREFGVVSMVPKELYEKATPTPGRFMLYTTAGQWRFMVVKRTSREKMAIYARQLSGRERSWSAWRAAQPAQDGGQKDVLSEVTEWAGDEDHKVAMLRAWAEALGYTPRAVDIERRYGVSKPTALKFHKLTFGEE